jgi:hypothetical protein
MRAVGASACFCPRLFRPLVSSAPSLRSLLGKWQPSLTDLYNGSQEDAASISPLRCSCWTRAEMAQSVHVAPKLGSCQDSTRTHGVELSKWSPQLHDRHLGTFRYSQLLRSRGPLPHERPTDPGTVPSAAIGHGASSKFFAGSVDCCSSTRAVCPLFTDHVRSGRTHNPFTPSSGPRPPACACAVTRRNLYACLKSVVMC